MQKLEQEIINKFQSLLKARVPVHRLILFGSRARGDAELFSDIDVLVIVDSELDDRIRELISDCAWRQASPKEWCWCLWFFPVMSGKKGLSAILFCQGYRIRRNYHLKEQAPPPGDKIHWAAILGHFRGWRIPFPGRRQILRESMTF